MAEPDARKAAVIATFDAVAATYPGGFRAALAPFDDDSQDRIRRDLERRYVEAGSDSIDGTALYAHATKPG